MHLIRRGLTGTVPRYAKAAIGWLLFRTGVYRFLAPKEAVVVVFHRVNDAYPTDPLTHTSRQFEGFVRFFGRHFKVVPLSELLRRLESGEPLGGLLAITFDDGYVGNATIAAPILERNGQRACFFVTTQFIGTDHIAWWDAEQNIQTRWMTWDQVRGLRAAGHDVGSHTETHPDLGIIPPDEARKEISGGSARLDKELGERSGLFAYPYGGRRNMSDANQRVVSEVGLRCCVSAYGGTVKNGDDPLRLKRTTISSWFLSPYQFGFELLTGGLKPS